MTTAAVARPSAVASTALKLAIAELGVVEQLPYSGKRVNAYLRSISMAPGNYWGWAFVYYIYRQSALTNGGKLPPLANGIIEFWNKVSKDAHLISMDSSPYVKTGKPYQLIESEREIPNTFYRKGDIYLMCSNGVWLCGIVESVSASGNLYGIEGCVVSNTYRNSVGVARKRRKAAQVCKLIRFV